MTKKITSPPLVHQPMVRILPAHLAQQQRMLLARRRAKQRKLQTATTQDTKGKGNE